MTLPSAGCVVTSFVGDLCIGDSVCEGALCGTVGFEYPTGRTSMAIPKSEIKWFKIFHKHLSKSRRNVSSHYQSMEDEAD